MGPSCGFMAYPGAGRLYLREYPNLICGGGIDPVLIVYVFRSNVIDRLQTTLPEDHGFAYCYCDFRNSAASNQVNIVRTLAAQLLSGWNHASTERFEDLFVRMSKGQTPPSTVDQLQDLVFRAAKLRKKNTIVIDALDECNDREDLLSFIAALRDERINVLVISRYEQDILDYLEDFPAIDLKREVFNLTIDMRKHVEEEFQNKKRWGRVRKDMQAEISASLLEGSENNM